MKTHKVNGGGGIQLHVAETGNASGRPILFLLPHAQVQLMQNTGGAAFWEDAAAFNEGLRAFSESL